MNKYVSLCFVANIVQIYGRYLNNVSESIGYANA